MPPRHLKSLCASVALPAWMLGHAPAAQIIAVSYGQDLSDKLARDCRSVMASPWYRSVFPTRLSPQRQAVQEFTTTKQGYRLATSVGGVLTGRGADMIIIDDPLKPEEAFSAIQRETVNHWNDHTLYSRLNDKKDGCIIIVMQRLHQDDLVGHVLEQEPWEVVSFPAIAEEYEEHLIETAFGSFRFSRQVGDLLHPARESKETLARIRQTLGEYNFAGQYQQAPASLGGGMVGQAWFKCYEPGEIPSSFDRIVQSWDTANKVTQLSDYSVCTTWGVKGKCIYLLHVLRKQLNYPELKRAVREQWQAFGAEVILVEDKASGTQLIQELIDEGVHGVTPREPEADKIMRLHAQTATIENGFVYLPTEAYWLADYMQELVTFPKGKYDDQVDSTSQALAWIKMEGIEPAIMQVYRKLYEQQQQNKKVSLVRLRAPPGIGSVYPVNGPTMLVGADGTIELPEEDAEPLIRAGWLRHD